MTDGPGGVAATRLTMGPVLFNWAPEAWRDFYFRIADEAPVDSVCLGEVVCSKRKPLFEPYLEEVAERLRKAGKELVLSTLALIMDEREMADLRAVAAVEGAYVEANDIAAVALLGGRPHVIGPFVSVYNEATLAYLEARGADRVCLPVELPGESVAAIAASADAEIEVLAFGRLPLAVSARCYHARSRNLHKDNCQFVCGEDPDGMEVETLDGDPFLAVNGIQVMSHGYCNLIGELDALREMGVRRFRLSPHDLDMVAAARLFRDVLDGRRASDAAIAELATLVGDAPFANGYFHGVEGAAQVARAATAE